MDARKTGQTLKVYERTKKRGDAHQEYQQERLKEEREIIRKV